MSDTFSDKIRESLRHGYPPARTWRRRLDRAATGLILAGVALYMVGSVMAAAAALAHLAGHP